LCDGDSDCDEFCDEPGTEYDSLLKV